MKKLNKAVKAAIISASVIAAPFIGYFTFRAGQNFKAILYFKELYPNCLVTEIKEIEYRGWFGGSHYTKKIKLYDKEHNFYFDQTFYYEGLKALPLDDANAYWREQYLKTAVACENIVNAVPECCNCEYFTRYNISSGANSDGVFIFLKQPSADEFEELVKKLSVVTDENYTPIDPHRGSEGNIKSTVIILSPELYAKMKNSDFSPIFEQKPDVPLIFKTALSANVIRIYEKRDTPPDVFTTEALTKTALSAPRYVRFSINTKYTTIMRSAAAFLIMNCCKYSKPLDKSALMCYTVIVKK